ncbi:hypothetical protein B0F90DRAFT_115643 [Multifurca ochricompacta]|uniref:Uncharacterized protein n=1 Tax=Multifurca ochricompacta TaxID=376703 RepID=A0AAD4MCX5_9AGAM|nr:hypothetical protein B0F90DRAFT_115643 [Multifurca ochricompacta]
MGPYMKRYHPTLLPRPPNKTPLPRPAPPGPPPPTPGPCSSMLRARPAIPSGGGGGFCCCIRGAPTGLGPTIPAPAPEPLPPIGVPHDALTNTPALRPASAPLPPPAALAVAVVIIAWGAFGGMSVCRRLGEAASPSTLVSSRKPRVNGLLGSAPALAHADEPPVGCWGALWKNVTVGGSGSMSEMPAAASDVGQYQGACEGAHFRPRDELFQVRVLPPSQNLVLRLVPKRKGLDQKRDLK